MKKTDKTIYNDDSIISLDPREFTRLRPSTYLGDNTYSTQLVKEIFANALDEHNIGHGDIISITVDTKKNKYTVEDNGQGFPINVSRDDNKTVLEAAFSVLNTSGKYDDKDGVYGGVSLGLNGIGSKLTNFLSKSLDVLTFNENGFEHIWFKDGLFEKREIGEWTKGTSGTIVNWEPDKQFFQNVEANDHDLKVLFEAIAALCPTLTINYSRDNKSLTYHSANGLQDLIDNKVVNKELFSNRFTIRKVEDNNLFDIVMTYTSDYSDNIIAYVNYGLTESGVHISTVKTLITKQINKYAFDNNLLKKNDDSFSGQELSEGLVIAFNVKATNVKYDSQTKVRVVDIDKTLMSAVLNNDFADWLNNNPKEARIIIDRALNARKAKEAAQNAKDRVRNATTKGKKFINLPTKLVDAYSKDRKECELIIVEGDSAKNGMVAKRDGKTQAVFPIRGKILSCRKATVDKVYANQEISNLVKALGLEIEKDTGKLIYDAKKLRYGKILLASDADEDGFDIRLLLINALWWLCPELILNGHIYAVVPPLFRITTKKNEYIYLKDQNALDDYKSKHSKEAFLINRMKGLGEMNPEEQLFALLDPKTRNVQQIIAEDFDSVDSMLEIFMGDKVPPRRDYLLEHYNDVQIDIE